MECPWHYPQHNHSRHGRGRGILTLRDTREERGQERGWRKVLEELEMEGKDGEAIGRVPRPSKVKPATCAATLAGGGNHSVGREHEVRGVYGFCQESEALGKGECSKGNKFTSRGGKGEEKCPEEFAGCERIRLRATGEIPF